MINLKSNKQFLREIYFLFGDDKKKLPKLIIMFLGLSLLDLAGLGLIGPYIALIIEPDKTMKGSLGQFVQDLGISMETSYLVFVFGIGLIVIFLVKSIASVLINKFIIKFAWERQAKLRGHLMHVYQNMPYNKYILRNSSDYIQSIQALAAQYSKGVLLNLLKLLSESIVALVVISFLFFIDSLLVVIVLSVLTILIFIYQSTYRQELKDLGENASESSRKIVQGINEGIAGFKEIRVLGKTSFFNYIVSDNAKKLADIQVRTNVINFIPRYFLEFAVIFFLVSFLSGAVFLNRNISSILASIGIVSMAVIRLKPIVGTLVTSINKIQYGRYATSKLYTDINELGKYYDMKSTYHPLKNEFVKFSSLILKGVSFKYPNTKEWALKEVNLSIYNNESIGLIGPSGSGKTTLVDVMLGLLEPEKGKLFFNDSNLKESLDNWWSQVAYIPQEVFIIDNTLKHNIALGCKDSEINDINISESLKQSRIDKFINELPKGVNTILGERGVRLSGGQRQRVALARAFYHKRNVLVMDEATSALDNKTEKEIVNEIKHLKGQKTLIVIAHRLSTVAHCDRIYRLEKGKIVEEGCFEKVVKRKKIVEY
jgi:ATP-binding cassette, subfamily B, bacterial PglK